MNTSKVWYVTGASQGLGLTLVKKLLDHGYRVAATSRNVQKLKEAVGVIDADRFLPLVVDLNNLDCIDESVQETGRGGHRRLLQPVCVESGKQPQRQRVAVKRHHG